MLGADRDRLAETERIGFQRAGCAGASLALVRDQDGGLARFADDVGKSAVGAASLRARASTRNSTASACAIAAAVCACIRAERLSRSASSRPAVSITLNERSPSLALPSRRSRVTPGSIIDQRQAAPDEPVEQRRFADIRAADDGDGKRHGESFAKDDRISRCRRLARAYVTGHVNSATFS